MRIRVGPLKGYICRVLAIRYSDVTVKLDSKQKVLTGLFININLVSVDHGTIKSVMLLFLFCLIIIIVKCEHLSEVRGKSSAMPMRYITLVLQSTYFEHVSHVRFA